MPGDKWTEMDLPLLRTIDEISEGSDDITTDDLEDATSLPRRELSRALRRLWDGDYLTGADATTYGSFELLDIRLLERGLRAVGTWPADSFDRLIDSLRAAEAAESDPDKKSRLQRLLDGLVGAGRDVAVSVLSEWAKAQAGL